MCADHALYGRTLETVLPQLIFLLSHACKALGLAASMEASGSGPRLIIVCGLLGSGKTMLAKELERGARVGMREVQVAGKDKGDHLR
jgi:hypothetical protein